MGTRLAISSAAAGRAIPLAAMLLAAVAAGCDKKSSPTAPTPAPVTTRVIALSGNLTFSDVPVGAFGEATLTISNTGTGVLTVAGISVSGGLTALFTASWTGGTVPAGGSQTVTVRFTPTEPASYSGTLTVNADQTSGTNTIPFSASAIAGFAGEWGGAHVITACNGTGSVQDLVCSANRGAFPPGARMIFGATLQQNGTNVTGTVNLGGLIGGVTGTAVGGILQLQGTATGNGFTAQITLWTTRVQGGQMTGNVNYNLTFAGVPGVAGIESRLDGVARR